MSSCLPLPRGRCSAWRLAAVCRVRSPRSIGDEANWVHLQPKFLPDGQHFIFLVRSAKAENTGLDVAALRSKETRRLVAT